MTATARPARPCGSAAYFDGAGAATAWWVLAGWLTVGLLLAGAGGLKNLEQEGY